MNIAYLLAFFGCLLQAAFIYTEHQKKYLPALILKTAASFFFCLIGFLAYRQAASPIARLIFFGLIFGLIGDFFLNLRFLSADHAQKIFLIGILFFLIGHIIYLCAIIPLSKDLPLCIGIGVIIAAALLAYIFKTMKVKMAFKIFGVFYLGAIIIMTVIAIGNFFRIGNTLTALYALGAIFFTLSDIVLIFNTFGSTSRFSLRIANLSLYYIGQLLIAFSLYFL